MSQNDDYLKERADDPSRTLDAGKPLHEIGTYIGSYKLLRILGEGGFGIVYLAEQQRPIKRQVALKIIKPGMDSTQVIRRFEAERQALALLDHPNVAHVYDADTTEAGRPYFAMEFVKGVPITEHCDRQKLTIEERLRLFIQVCEAIQHAHQKGIIHRDIKPSNIQVCIEGEQAIPKVIDFGVAKALSQPLTERTLVTEQGQLIGTPEYISPEQAEMTNQDIDTRSDIYSLGVLLYELLTGTLPFESQTLRRGSLDQMRQIIRETEPKTPSTRVSSLDAEASTRLAKCCQNDTATLRRRLRGDLDWITLKAMDKDRMRRYQTAHALAEDIERHLNNEPVLAGRPGTLYRFQKLVRRNKVVFAAASIVSMALIVGLAVSTWMFVRERQARERAVAAEQAQSRLRQEAETARAEEAAQRRQAEALAYASDMSLAQEALARSDLGRARRLLEAHRPAAGEVDLPGWEWRYLWQECRSDALAELCRYPNSVHTLAYSRDGKLLAASGDAYTQRFVDIGFVDIWDVPSRKRIKALDPNEGHFVAFSPRGDLLATGAENQVRLWRTDTWDSVRQLPLDGYVWTLRFSRDGTRLAALSDPGEATVWAMDQVDQWPVVRRVTGVKGGEFMGRLDFSPDGKTLAIGDAAHHLQAVDLATGDRIFDIPEAHPEGITAVAWSPNGSVIASGGGFAGGPIKLWDAASGKELRKLEGHTLWISALIFSADGTKLYSAGGDQTIRIWDVEQRRCLVTLRGSQDEVLGLALSPDSTMLASAGKDGVVAFWSTLPRPKEKSPKLSEFGRFGRPAIPPDSRVLAVPRDGTVRLFDLATLSEVEQLPLLGSNVTRVCYSPDGTLLVSGSQSGKVRVWSCAERALLKELDDHKEPIWLLQFRADGTRLFSLDVKGRAIWWDTLTWQATQTFVTQTFVMGLPILGGGLSPDGRLLALSANTGAVHWVNAQTGDILKTTPGGHREGGRVIAFSADGMKAASLGVDGTLALWDPSSFQRLTPPFFKGHMMAGQWAAFSPDGQRLATSSVPHEIVKLWDPSTNRELMTLPGQGSDFAYVGFSPDGNLIVATNIYGQIHLWRAPSWAEIEAVEKNTQSIPSP